MKRSWPIGLLALLLCVISVSALAAEGTIIPKWQEGEPIRTIQDMLTVGDTAYFKMRTDEGGEIWHWREGMDKAEPIATGVTFADSYTDIAQAYEELDRAKTAGEVRLPDLEHAITCLFTDGETLYAFNNLNRRVFTVDFAEGKAVFTDVVTLQDTAHMYRESNGASIYHVPSAVCAAGDTMLWLDWNWPESEHRYSDKVRVYTLTCYSLQDGSSRTATLEDPRILLPYKDGKALVMSPTWTMGEYSAWTEETYRMYVYDPATDTAQERGTIVEPPSSFYPVYSEEQDAVFFQKGGYIVGKKDFGMPETYASAPDELRITPTIVGDTVLEWMRNYVEARTLTPGYTAERSLCISTEHEAAERAFAEKYPSVPIRHFDSRLSASSEPTQAEVWWKEPGLDVINMLGDDSTYHQACEEGAFLDLSGNETIRAYVDSLYPVFRDLAEQDGKIYGIPVAAVSYNGFFINKKVQQDLGLAKEDIPTNLTDLCAFVSQWNEANAKKYPTYALLENVTSYRDRIFALMYSAWLSYCQSTGQELHFDDPIFREMLTALDQMDSSVLDEAVNYTDLEDSDYMQGLIWDGCKLIGNFASYMEDYSDRIFIPMTMTADSPYIAKASDVQMWCIRADTENADMAIALLEEILSAMDVKQKAVLQSTYEGAVRNPEYDEIVARVEENIRTLQDISVPNGDPSYREIEKAIRKSKDFLNGPVQRQKYRITASALQNYKEVIAPALCLYDLDALGLDRMQFNALYNLRELYGAYSLIDMETFIRAADDIVTMDAASTDQNAQARYAVYQELSEADSSSQFPAIVKKLKELFK